MTEQETFEIAIKATVDSLIDGGKEFFKGLSDETRQIFNTGFRGYLRKQKEKYSKIKTLLHGNQPIYIYDLYYQIDIEFKNETIDTKTISNIFRKCNYVTIIGDAGSGKSTLIKHLFLNTLLENYGIPILIELRYLNDYDNNIQAYISERILEDKLSQNISILERMLTKGEFIFFLDGFDELNSKSKDKIIKGINNFINKYNENKFILTTRPYANIELLPLFINYQIKQLNKKDINAFILLQLKEEEEFANKIIKSIDENKGMYIESFLANPLLLTLYILTFQSNATIPNKKYLYYRRVIDALFIEHDSKTKIGFVREKASSLTQEQFEEILKRFCFLSYFGGRYDFDKDFINSTLQEIKDRTNNFDFDNNNFILDMELAIALWIEDGGLIKFAHRSIQEYFAALFIKGLDDDNKKKIYDKIRYKILNVEFGESQNFLSLLDEMDQVNYTKYIIIPLLKHLQKGIIDQDANKLLRSFVYLFFDEISIDLNTNKISKSVANKKTKSIANSIEKVYEFGIKAEKLINPFRSTSKKKKSNENLEIKPKHYQIKRLSSSTIKYYKTTDLINIATDFKNYLNDAISKSEIFVKESIKSDKDLVGLI